MPAQPVCGLNVPYPIARRQRICCIFSSSQQRSIVAYSSKRVAVCQLRSFGSLSQALFIVARERVTPRYHAKAMNSLLPCTSLFNEVESLADTGLIDYEDSACSKVRNANVAINVQLSVNRSLNRLLRSAAACCISRLNPTTMWITATREI